jgi:hypothetical protein
MQSQVHPAAPQTSKAHSGNALANAPRAVGSAHSPWPDYRDMTAAQMLAWGAAESAARQADLAGVKDADSLKRAQANAVSRRKAIGAGTSAAASMVIDANRAARIAKATGDQQ